MRGTKSVGVSYGVTRCQPIGLAFVVFLSMLGCAESQNELLEPIGSGSAEPSTLETSDAALRPSAYRAYRDPVTGELTAAPDQSASPLQAPAISLSRSLSRSSDGLVQVQTGDGVKVDLQGRFMSARVATLAADGSIVVGEGLPADRVADNDTFGSEDQ